MLQWLQVIESVDSNMASIVSNIVFVKRYDRRFHPLKEFFSFGENAKEI